MNKLTIAIGVLALLVVGWFFLKGDTVSYVADVESEVFALESELVELEAAVEAGTLTPEEAAKAQERILARLEAIDDAVASGRPLRLTDAQRKQLVSALETLRSTLITHKDVFVAIDKKVLELPEEERPLTKRKGGGGSATFTEIVTEAVESVENQVEAVVDDYASEDTDMTEATITDNEEDGGTTTSTEDTQDTSDQVSDESEEETSTSDEDGMDMDEEAETSDDTSTEETEGSFFFPEDDDAEEETTN